MKVAELIDATVALLADISNYLNWNWDTFGTWVSAVATLITAFVAPSLGREWYDKWIRKKPHIIVYSDGNSSSMISSLWEVLILNKSKYCIKEVVNFYISGTGNVFRSVSGISEIGSGCEFNLNKIRGLTLRLEILYLIPSSSIKFCVRTLNDGTLSAFLDNGTKIDIEIGEKQISKSKSIVIIAHERIMILAFQMAIIGAIIIGRLIYIGIRG